MAQSYGVTQQKTIASSEDVHLEELTIKGFSILEGVLHADQLAQARTKLDEVYARQVSEFGEDKLQAIKEKNMARCPLAYDEYFLSNVAANPKVLSLVKRRLGDYFILHLQNGIINRPNEPHHQSSWHRDLPYQNFVSSKPLAIGALFCIDPFTVETGCTEVVPFTHREETSPSNEYIEANRVPAVAREPYSLR